MKSGFTLIETLLYLALFSIIIGGVLVSAYQIIQASTASQENALIQEEGHFLVAKFNWAMTGATAINEPTPPPPPGTNSGLILQVDKPGFPSFITFTTNGADLLIDKGSGPLPLNSDSVRVENLIFTTTTAVNKPTALQANFRVTSKLTGKYQDFSTTKYLRQ